MSLELVLELFCDAIEDVSLAERVLSCESLNELANNAKAAGFDISVSDLQSFAAIKQGALSSSQSGPYGKVLEDIRALVEDLCQHNEEMVNSIRSDELLLERLRNAAGADEAASIALEAGYDLDVETIVEILQDAEASSLLGLFGLRFGQQGEDLIVADPRFESPVNSLIRRSLLQFRSEVAAKQDLQDRIEKMTSPSQVASLAEEMGFAATAEIIESTIDDFKATLEAYAEENIKQKLSSDPEYHYYLFWTTKVEESCNTKIAEFLEPSRA